MTDKADQTVTKSGHDNLLHPGELIDGRFQVVRFLAEGGMGQIYIATQRPLGRKVALKVMHKALLSDQTNQRRFLQEAVAVSKLDHPHTIKVYDFGELNDGSVYMAMEFIDGTPLQEVILEEGSIAPGRSLRIALQICESLAEAHEKGIVHRDLKPDNIFLASISGQKDFVKVLDFGIAKILEENNTTQLTIVGHVCGTPEYMAPEQARGEKLDGKADLYALGIMLYEMLTGSLPFEALSPVGMIVKHQNEPLPAFPENIPQNICTFVENLTHKLPKDRPENALIVIEMLKQLLAAHDTFPKFPSSNTTPLFPGSQTLDLNTQTLEITSKKKKALPIVIISLLSLALLFLGIKVLKTSSEEPQINSDQTETRLEPVVESQETTEIPDPELETILEAIPVLITSDPTRAELQVNGRFMGTTETTVDLIPNKEAEFIFRLDGYEELHEQIFISPNEDEPFRVNVTLTHLPSTLVLSSDPTGATVSLENEILCTTPCEHALPFSETPILLTFSKENRRDREVEVIPNQLQLSVTAELRRSSSSRSSRSDSSTSSEESETPEPSGGFRPVSR